MDAMLWSFAALRSAAAEKPKPNVERLREFRDSALPSVEQQLFSTAPVYKSLDSVLLADSLAEMQDALGKDNPDVQKVLQGKSPADAAKDLITNTKLDDGYRRVQVKVNRSGVTAMVSPPTRISPSHVPTPAKREASSGSHSGLRRSFWPARISVLALMARSALA